MGRVATRLISDGFEIAGPADRGEALAWRPGLVGLPPDIRTAKQAGIVNRRCTQRSRWPQPKRARRGTIVSCQIALLWWPFNSFVAADWRHYKKQHLAQIKTGDLPRTR